MRALFISCLLASTAAQAQVPSSVEYQGRLLDSTGAPRAGTVSLELAIFDSGDPGTGNPIWCEVHANISVTDGYYAVRLGEGKPCVPPTSTSLPSAFGAGDRYLEVKVEGTPLEPRQKIVSVPFAFVAASLANGGASFVQNQTATPQPAGFNIAGTGYVTGPASFTGSGSVVATHGTNTVTGSTDPVATRFGTEVTIGDLLIIEGEARHVIAISDAKNLTVESSWTNDHVIKSFSVQKPVVRFNTYSTARPSRPHSS